MKSSIIALIASVFCVQSVFASASSAVTYHGKVVSEAGTPIPFVTIVALTPSDSAYVTGAMTDDNGQFSFAAEQRTLLLKATNVGFQTKWMNVTSADLGTITLQQEATRLGEVVVSAKKATVTRDGLNYSISNLAGTHIGEAGTLYDMLGWTPGVVTYDINSIKVGGSMSVGTIYINEQKVTDRNILLSIPSSQVSKIEVIRDPGVRYSAESGAVIKITLKKQLKDHIGISATNNVEVRRRVSDDGWINLSGKFGKFSFMGSVVEQYVKRKAFDGGGASVANSEGIIAYTDVFNSEFTSVNTGPLWSAGLNYLAKPTLNFILQYAGSSTNVDFKKQKTHQLSMNGAEAVLDENTHIPHRKSSRHNVTTGMTYTSPSGHFFNITMSYSRQNKGEAQFIDIFNITDDRLSQKNIVSSSKYDLLDAEANWRFSQNGNDWALGYNLGVIKNSYYFINDATTQSTVRTDYTNTLYGSWQRKINKLKLSLGARLMHNITKLTQSAQGNDDRTFVVRPYININYSIADDYSIGTYYTMYVGYPSISQFNPAVVYIDTLRYEKGNENLKNAYAHVVAFFANIKDITLSIDFKRVNNMIVTGSFPYGENGAIIDQPINSRYSNTFSFDASYSTSIGKFRIDPEFGYEYQFTKLPNISEMLNSEFGQHSIYISCNMSYKFRKTAEVFSLFGYQSPWYDGAKRIGRTLRLNIGASKTFFEGKLRTAIELTDLVGEAVTPRWGIDFSNIKRWYRNKYDTRGIKFSVRYTFNSVKTSFRGAQINKGTTERAD